MHEQNFTPLQIGLTRRTDKITNRGFLGVPYKRYSKSLSYSTYENVFNPENRDILDRFRFFCLHSNQGYAKFSYVFPPLFANATRETNRAAEKTLAYENDFQFFSMMKLFDLDDFIGNGSTLALSLILDAMIVALHSIGFYLLRKVRPGKFNANNFLVSHLSAIDIVYGVASFAVDSLFLEIFHQKDEEWITKMANSILIFNTLVLAPGLQYTILLITFNRFLACVCPVFYRKNATKRVFLYTITGMWVFIVVCLVIVRKCALYFGEREIITYYMMGGIVLIFLTILWSYTRIYLKLVKSSQRVSRHLPGRHNLKLPSIAWNFIFHQGHITALLIVLCHGVFIFTPLTIQTVKLKMWYMAVLFFKLSSTLDAVIYVYTDKEVKKLLLLKLAIIRRYFSSMNKVDVLEVEAERAFTPAFMSRSNAGVDMELFHL